MKKSLTSITVVAVLGLVILGFGAYAFADRGMGYGHRGWAHYGQDMHHDDWCGSGDGYRKDDLSNDAIEQLEKEQKAFFSATQNLRQDIYAKELELKSELIKENPDADKAKILQKEISDLEGKIDQKRIDHMINMRKINPNAGRHFMGRGGMSYGRAQGGYCRR